jgi:hypothetical protein
VGIFDMVMDKAARETARELCEKATPGPWVSEHEVTGRVPDAGCGIVASDDHTKISNPSRGIVAWACRLVSRTNAETKANAAFISAARTLLPQALDALDAADIQLTNTIARETQPTRAIVEALTNRFLRWPLPQSVNSDTCVTYNTYEYPRHGTNLLSADEARQMIEYLLEGEPLQPTAALEKTP